MGSPVLGSSRRSTSRSGLVAGLGAGPAHRLFGGAVVVRPADSIVEVGGAVLSASTRTMVAPGASAWAHSMSSDSSSIQPLFRGGRSLRIGLVEARTGGRCEWGTR